LYIQTCCFAGKQERPIFFNFYCLTSCIEYLSKLGLTIKRDTLTRYIKNEKVFHNFLCKYSNKVLPNNFLAPLEVGLIIDEYKKWKVDTELGILKVNRKNKPILVKGKNFLLFSFFFKKKKGATALKNFQVLQIQLNSLIL